MSKSKIVKWLIASPFILIGVGIAFCEANKAYWDHQVKQWCEKDGGVTVFEKTSITSRYMIDEKYIRIPSAPPVGRSPFKWEAKFDDDFYYDIKDNYLKTGYPSIVKTISVVVRASDKKTLGQAVRYSRRGGDFPTGIIHGSSYTCPDGNSLEESVFIKPN
jgi:hypothetical protein